MNLAKVVEESSSGVTDCKPHEDKETEEIHPPFIWTTTQPTTRTTILITTSHYSRTKPTWETMEMEKAEERELKTTSQAVETTTRCTGEGTSFLANIKNRICTSLEPCSSVWNYSKREATVYHSEEMIFMSLCVFANVQIKTLYG